MISGVAVAVVLVAALHVLRPDLPPLGSRLSEYANGPHGAVMVAAFLAVAGAVLAFALVVARLPGSRLLVMLAALACLGLAGSAVYRTQGAGAAEQRHSVASTTGTVALTAASAVWALQRAPRRPPVGRWLAGAATVLTAVSPLLHDTAVTGLGQRLLWAALLAWLVLAAGDGGTGVDARWPRPQDCPAAPLHSNAKADHG